MSGRGRRTALEAALRLSLALSFVLDPTHVLRATDLTTARLERGGPAPFLDLPRALARVGRALSDYFCPVAYALEIEGRGSGDHTARPSPVSAWKPHDSRGLDASERAQYVFGSLYVDEPVQMRRGPGAWWFHQNAVFSVATVTDQNGAVVERCEYRSIYGRHEIQDAAGVARPWSVVGNPWRFQGRRLDDETGLLYFRARFYDPDEGRFVSRDPVLDPLNSGNQYAFCRGNPLNRVDPTGRFGPDWLVTDPREYRKSFENIVSGFGSAIKEVGATIHDAAIAASSLAGVETNRGYLSSTFGSTAAKLSAGTSMSQVQEDVFVDTLMAVPLAVVGLIEAPLEAYSGTKTREEIESGVGQNLFVVASAAAPFTKGTIPKWMCPEPGPIPLPNYQGPIQLPLARATPAASPQPPGRPLLRFYHGTDEPSGQSVERGVRPNPVNPEDPSFHLTTDPLRAEAYARARAADTGSRPVVVEVTIPEESFFDLWNQRLMQQGFGPTNVQLLPGGMELFNRASTRTSRPCQPAPAAPSAGGR